MSGILNFILRMDAKAVRAVLVSLALFAALGALFVSGKMVFDSEQSAVGAWFEWLSDQWFALPLTVALFIALSFVGFPQFVLMGAAVVAFGPIVGFLYAWLGTLAAASVHYWLGLRFGSDIVARYGGEWANRISDFIGRNGMMASIIVRFVPSGPFIVVNMGFGVTRTPYWAFLIGLAIGAACKIVIVSLGWQIILDFFNNQDPMVIAILIAAMIAWIGLMLLARRWLRRNRDVPAAANTPPADPSED